MRILLIPLLVALGSGCYATAGGSYGYGGTVTATTVAPDLVYVSPGVQVIADYDEPIFYADGYYWREHGGVWYRSTYYTGGWVYASAPRPIISIQNRHSYRRYRPAGYVPRHHHYRRDHRHYRPQPQRTQVYDYRDRRPQPRAHDYRSAPRHNVRPSVHRPQPQPRVHDYRRAQPQPRVHDYRRPASEPRRDPKRRVDDRRDRR